MSCCGFIGYNVLMFVPRFLFTIAPLVGLRWLVLYYHSFVANVVQTHNSLDMVPVHACHPSAQQWTNLFSL